MRQSRPATLSSLERLPLELLQYIFLESMNFNLPRASPTLCYALSSRHIKIKLVLSVFAGHRDGLDSERWSLHRCSDIRESEPCRKLSKIQRQCSDIRQSESCRKFSKLQRRVLRLRWLTIDIMKECMKIFLLKNVLSILGENSVWVVARSRDRLTGVRSNNDIAYSIVRGVGMKLESRSSQDARLRKLRILPTCGAIGLELKPLTDGGGGKLDILKVGGRCYHWNVVGGYHYEHLGNEIWDLPSFHEGCQIPQRLLHRP